MNGTTQTAQAEQHQTTRLNIDFSHRMPSPFFDMQCPHNLTNAVNQSTDRAIGVLHMLAGEFIGEEDCRLNDGIMYNVIMAVIREVEDVNSIVNAFSDAAWLKSKEDAKQEKQSQPA
ncbi:MAG: hypothetical protein WCP01_10400 [Methylococcaceae bacterium]